MLTNRSIPQCTVIPELGYRDVGEATDWLCKAFGFALRLRIGNHRAQLHAGDGAVIVTERAMSEGHEAHGGAASQTQGWEENTHSVLVRVDDVDKHCERATQHGARILRPPADYPYGERQYTAVDLGGHRWKFSQSIADVAPEEWGGTPGQL